MKVKLVLAGLALTASMLGLARTASADDVKTPATFGSLESTPAAQVKAKALAWLKATGADATKLSQFESLWAREGRSTLDNLADSFALGNADAAALLKDLRDPAVPPGLGVPSVLKEVKDPFFRGNFGLIVARMLSNRRAHEECLLILNGITPEQTVDPAAYLFYRAVCEHALLKRDDAGKTIVRLIQDATDSPERYKTVGALMLLDMQTWKKDLGNVARLMSNSERRLDIARGGDETKKIQKEIVARLDELIKELENKAKKGGGGGGGGGGGPPNDGSCPDGSSPGDGKGSAGGPSNGKPMQDSQIANNGGTGKVDVAKINKMIDGWGKMAPAERAKAAQEVRELIQDLHPIHRDAFERYIEEISQQPAAGGTKKQ
jgi:hypothetical protein